MDDDWSSFQRSLIEALPRMRRFALSLARHQEAAEDLVQATVERALRNWRMFDRSRRIDSWVFKIMQNLWLDSRRSAAVVLDSGEEAPDVVGEDGRRVVEDRDEFRRARQAFAVLKPEQQAVMALVVLEGLTYAEVAQALNIPIGTVMSRLARARAAMAAQMAQPPRVASKVDP